MSLRATEIPFSILERPIYVQVWWKFVYAFHAANKRPFGLGYTTQRRKYTLDQVAVPVISKSAKTMEHFIIIILNIYANISYKKFLFTISLLNTNQIDMTDNKFNLSDLLASVTSIITVCRFLNYLSGAVVLICVWVYCSPSIICPWSSVIYNIH